MTKKIDANGYWYIKHNPISKEGVFPYLGHTISEDCEPNKIYKVYRPAKTLQESVDSWDNPPKPFIDDHEMLGEGFTAIDERPVQGIIYNPVCEDGVLYADIAVYSEDLKHNIENGKKELSLGYFCKYKKERGVFKGEVYDYVQTDMVGNHIALVDAGRCGSDVKVFDRKCTMDSMPVSGSFKMDKSTGLKKTNESGKIEITEQKESGMNYVSIEAVRSALTEAFTYGDGEVDPKVKLVVELLEAKAKPMAADEDDTDKDDEKKSEDEDDTEEKETEDKCGKDSDDEKEDKKAEDALDKLMAVVKDMADDIKKLVADKEDDKEKETEDEDEKEKETEDEDDDESDKETEDSESDEEETKKSEDSAVFVFGADSAIKDDEALQDYLK